MKNSKSISNKFKSINNVVICETDHLHLNSAHVRIKGKKKPRDLGTKARK